MSLKGASRFYRRVQTNGRWTEALNIGSAGRIGSRHKGEYRFK
ncbi:hypothetical protein [Paenibacillus medicaginis]|uniref:Uncharacterized protein n=1 Tax=Paenibacillus medicaginis TaxID=1470560 RepID=A0ABV5C0W4_9BACL